MHKSLALFSIAVLLASTSSVHAAGKRFCEADTAENAKSATAKFDMNWRVVVKTGHQMSEPFHFADGAKCHFTMKRFDRRIITVVVPRKLELKLLPGHSDANSAIFEIASDSRSPKNTAIQYLICQSTDGKPLSMARMENAPGFEFDETLLTAAECNASDAEISARKASRLAGKVNQALTAPRTGEARGSDQQRPLAPGMQEPVIQRSDDNLPLRRTSTAAEI